MSLVAPIQHARILLVDDDQLAIDLCSVVLVSSGFTHVDSTTQPGEVLERHRVQPYDLIVLDLAMPGCDGMHLLPELASTANCPVPVIVISAEAESRLAAIRQGAVEFLAKPFDPEELVLRVRQVLDTHLLKLALQEQVVRYKEASDRLQLYRSATENSVDAIFIVNPAQDRFVDANATACRLLDTSRQALMDLSVSSVGIAPFSRGTSEAPVDASEATMFRPDGSKIEVELRWQRLPDSASGLAALTVRELSLRSEAEQRLRMLADFDTLTGLPNRRQFFAMLTQMLRYAEQSGQAAAVMFIDLDRFKNINDNLGHAVGDALLREFGARVSRCARTRDLVARLGGDEFAILMVFPRSTDTAIAVATKVREALAAPFALKEQSLSVTASIGIAMYPDDSVDADMLVQYADIAMYRSKSSGRNTYRFFTPEMNLRGLERLNLESALRNAIEQDEFRLHYQPKMDSLSGVVCGMEALLRWERPQHGLVSPAEFIPLLEETGLIVQVGAWVVRTAALQARAWIDAGIDPVPIAVNVSARQFYDRELHGTIQNALAVSGIDPRLLELELTESILMSNADEMVAYLSEIRALGVTLAIDDFGTGYSSLAYLKRFPIDTLKIDIAFVRDIISNPEDAAIALAIISMAHVLNMRVVAEGVESEGQLNYLRSHDCDEIQGFYFSRAIAASDVPSFLVRHRAVAMPARSPEQHNSLLIVDDEPDTCDMLAYCLTDCGYRIFTATSAQDAFSVLANNRIDVIVSDQRMPHMSGNELLRRVKNLYPEIVRIAMSGAQDQTTVAAAINEGAVFKFLPKPWNLGKAKSLIKEAFAEYHRVNRIQ